MRRKLFILFLFNFLFNWELTLFIEDLNDAAEAANDYLVLGTCQDCHDGFHYGEDQYDPPTGISPYTDIQFFNLDWLGTIDSNGNECDNPEFAVDKKSTHPPADLLEWGIRGVTMGHSSPLQITWDMDDLSDDYEIYLYIGQNGYNMRLENSVNINSDDLFPVYEQIDGEWVSFDNIKILIGGCASTGMALYYIDEDQDGLGTGVPQEFCPGFEPESYVDNNIDNNDFIYCTSNNIDDCNICDGDNNDMDCAGICFGNAELDDCGICQGGNNNMDCTGTCFGDAELDDCGVCQGNNNNMDCAGTCFGNAELDDCGVCQGTNESCLDEIFSSMPYNLHALINTNNIYISWDSNIENNFVEGFNIYYGNNESDLTLITSTQDNSYQTTDFTDGTFCVSIFDRFNNESELICTIATEYSVFNYTFNEGANLISFPYIPEDSSVENIFSSIQEQLEGIIGEGNAAYYDPILGWVGNLDEIDYSRGYWVKVIPNENIGFINLNALGFPNSGNIVYNLHEGYNLISYNETEQLLIEQAIPEELKEFVISIIGEGRASIYNSNTDQWLGNLDELEFGTGYWIEVTTSLSFYWNTP